VLARPGTVDPPPPVDALWARAHRQISAPQALSWPCRRLVPGRGGGVDDARADGGGGRPRAFKRASWLRAAATAARVLTARARYPPCSCEISAEEFQLRKPLISCSDECCVPDATAVAAVPNPSNINSRSNSQRPEIVCAAQWTGKLPASLPPTGGIALLIDILAREALKELMTKRSMGCKPGNLR
jgi:hypothetical protein